MTTTQTRVLPDLDEALDWDPTCEWGAGCDRAAAWFGQPPCKHDPKMSCQEHRAETVKCKRRFRCRECAGRFYGREITWRPL